MIAWEALAKFSANDRKPNFFAPEKLHNLTTKLILCNNFSGALDDILDEIINFHNADFGNVQLYRPQSRTLEIARQRGFKPEFLKTFETVSNIDPCACGRALRLNKPIVIESVDNDPEFVPYIKIAQAAGFRAVQSTPMITSDGKIVGVLSTHFRESKLPSDDQMLVTSLYASQAADILERLRSEELSQSGKDLVTKELNHRLKNILTMVQAIARQSLRASSNLEEFSDKFNARLVAISRAHSILAETQWHAASIRSLLQQQLVAIDDEVISISGPDVKLDANAAYIFSLVVHEIGVNSQKYGALSSSGGRVLVEWVLDRKCEAILFRWSECGGPRVAPPKTEGFGSALIRTLNGAGLVKIETIYEPSGVVCKMRLPLNR